MKKGLLFYSPVELASLRLGIAGLFFLPFINTTIKKIPKSKILIIFIVALIGNGGPALLFAIAQTKINSSVAGMLNASVPIFSVLIASFFIKTKISKGQNIGILIGFLGAIGLSLSSVSELTIDNFKYIAFVLIACLGYGCSINIIKKYLNDIKPIHIASLSFYFVGIPPLIYILFFTDFFSKTMGNPQSYISLSFILILGVVGTATALLIFYRLVKNVSIAFASSVTYLMPIIAVIWGILDGEILNIYQFISIMLIIFGVYFISFSERRIPTKL